MELTSRQSPYYAMERARIIRLGVTILAVLCGWESGLAEWMRPLDWETYRSECFGYSLLFPAGVLEQHSETPDGRGVELSSKMDW